MHGRLALRLDRLMTGHVLLHMTAHVLLHLLHLMHVDVHLKWDKIVRTVERRTNVLQVNKIIINRKEKMKDDS